MESSSKITQDIIRDKEDALIKLTNSVEIYKQSIENFENQEKKLAGYITNLKAENKLIREELSKSKNNINIEEVLNKNVKFYNLDLCEETTRNT